MFVYVLLQLVFVGVYCNEQSNLHGDEFHEELLIKPLPSGHVYVYFQFTTFWQNDVSDEPHLHCHLFPQTLAEVLHQQEVDEMHLSITSGIWRHERWGYPVFSAPPGAELWAWFKDGTLNVDDKWTLFSNALSGLFCASLNFVNLQQSQSPKFSFPPWGTNDGSPRNNSFLRYSSLPREIVCTENLTPFKKLLPCDSKKGLASLLNAGYIHNANYHSLGFHVRPQCKDESCREVLLELRQTVSLVYDMHILGHESKDWSFRKLFGSGLSGPCPLASTSKIYVDFSTNGSSAVYHLSPEPTAIIKSERGGYTTDLALYDMKKISANYMFNIASVHSGSRTFFLNSPPILHATRYIIGYGQERGGIVTKVHNNHWREIDIVFFENVPWYISLYYHTLRVTTNTGEVLQPCRSHYSPGQDREKPYALELLITLPPRTVTEIYLEFDYNFLKWQEYPPDANHGFYVGSAVITAVLPHTRNYSGIPIDGSFFSSSFNASRDGYPVTLHTEILILTLPTPDFSMPYNVICLACTVVALAFGPLHNHTTKMLAMQEVDDKSVTSILKSKCKSLWAKIRRQQSVSTASSENITKEDDCASEASK